MTFSLPHRMGFTNADQFLPLILALPEQKKVYCLHLLKGMALTYVGYQKAGAYAVNGEVTFNA